MTLRERFEAKVDRRGPDDCWPWLGHTDPQGYARLRDDRGRAGEVLYAHRVAWELAVGPIPAGLTIDHVVERGCTRRDCTNPAHLEPVRIGDNVRRSSHPNMRAHAAGTCLRGHDLATEACRRADGRVVYCRACRREDRRK